MIDFKYEYNKYKEKLQLAVAQLMPKWLVYWCAIRLGANATGSKYPKQIVPELNFMEALDRWNK